MKFYCRSTLCLVLLLGSAIAYGQGGQNQQQQEVRELPPVSKNYVITNANIIQGPGRNIGRGNVVIRGGLIHAVGKNISIPPDAITIKGDSLYVYPGFIDGLTRNGVTKPKEDPNRERPKDPGNPTPEQAGITPQNDVRSGVNPAEKTIEEFRALGFTAAQVVPYGGMLPGSASVLLYSGKTTDNMTLVGKSGLYSELSPAQRMYPNTVIGVIAKWRELYRQALQASDYEKVYAANRSGLARPASDRLLESFYPVISKQIPVLFEADRYLDIQRVLSLQNEFKFPVALGDVKEGWDAIPNIKASGAKVFLSLDLPEDKKFEAKEKKESKKEGDKKDELKKEEQKADPEKDALEKRKEDAIKTYTAQALTFQKAGIPFGFSTLSVKSTDIQKNFRRMLAAGLTEDQLLAALTTSPAQLLGLSDRLGTVDAGKIANLVISDKPYFTEKAKVRYVFVDGVMYKYDPKEAPKETSSGPNITGSWTITTENASGKSEDVVTFKKDGNSYSGSVTGPKFQQAVSLENIEMTGNKLKFSYTTQAEGQSLKVDFDVTIEGDAFKGTATAGASAPSNVAGKKNPNR